MKAKDHPLYLKKSPQTYEEAWLEMMRMSKLMLPHASLEELTEIVDRGMATVRRVEEGRGRG